MSSTASRCGSVGLLALVALTAPIEVALAQCLGPRRVPATRDSLRVGADWLSRHAAADPDLVILHLDRDRAGFERGHIPGARFLDAAVFLDVGRLDDRGDRGPRLAALADSLRQVGVSNGSRIVLYGDPLRVAPAFLALDVLGHGERVAVLDGGLRAWRELDLSIAADAAAITPGDFEPRPEAWRVVNAEWVRAAVERPETVIVDARSQEEYEADHVPTARHLDWRLTLRGGVDADLDASPSLRSVGELRRLFRSVGIDAAEEVVFYSDDVARAAHLYFVARYLGYEPRFLAGPWRAARGRPGS